MAACNCTGACRYGGGCAATPRVFGTFSVPYPDLLAGDPARIKPHDDPLHPSPLPLAGSWQCGGCGTIYSAAVNRCECQTHRFVTSGNSMNFKLYPAPPSEMP